MKTAGIYLDYAAATPLDDGVLRVMQPYFAAAFHNPSSLYSPAREAKKALQSARTQAASILGAKSAEIIFTAGATEANNLAIQGVMRKHPGKKLLVSAIEHDSVMSPAKLWGCQKIRVDGQGILDIADLHSKIDDQTVLVSVMYANNEVGTVQPLRKISQLIEGMRRDRKKAGNNLPLLLHADAAQAGNYLDLHVHRLGADLMTINAGKIYGPKQAGALYVKAGTVLEPLVLGGGQERGLRSGTENVSGAVGLAEALALAQSS
jgi:cysteine desulfurase